MLEMGEKDTAHSHCSPKAPAWGSTLGGSFHFRGSKNEGAFLFLIEKMVVVKHENNKTKIRWMGS